MCIIQTELAFLSRIYPKHRRNWPVQKVKKGSKRGPLKETLCCTVQRQRSDMTFVKTFTRPKFWGKNFAQIVCKSRRAFRRPLFCCIYGSLAWTTLSMETILTLSSEEACFRNGYSIRKLLLLTAKRHKGYLPHEKPKWLLVIIFFRQKSLQN